MTCLFCNYEFCYMCGGDASHDANHWTPGVGCGASMMRDTSGGPRGCFSKCMNKLFMILLVIVVFPFFLVLTPPIGVTFSWIAMFGSIHPGLGCCCCLLFPIPFAIGCVMLICWIPFVVIGGPIYLINMCVKRCKSKRQNRSQALERINEIVEKNRRLVA